MSALLKAVDLYEWAECKQRSKLIEWLNENNIAYRLSRTGNPITTIDAINASLNNKTNDDDIEFM